MTELQKYPKRIASLEKKLLKLNQQIETQLEILGYLDGDIETAIAANCELRNEQQRRAKRLELQQKPDYLDLLRNIRAAKEERELWVIELNRVKNFFAVLKLETRLQIASLESVA